MELKKHVSSELWIKYKSEKNEKKKLKYQNQLIEQYYPLVKKIGDNLAFNINYRLPAEELVSYGIDGLYIAMEKFDINRGVKFESYASIRIYGSMIDNIRQLDIVPRSVRIRNNTYHEAKQLLESKKGNKVLEDEVFEELGRKNEKYWKNRKRYNPVSFSSLEGVTSSSENDPIKQDHNYNLIDEKCHSPESIIQKKEFFNKLMSKNFSKTERTIIYLYYYENFTMDMIASKLEISESNVSHLHRKIIPRLKEKILRNPTYFSEQIKFFTET
jgi:RNA polymerase sigma factor FliA